MPTVRRKASGGVELESTERGARPNPTTVSMPPASLRTTELHPAAQLLKLKIAEWAYQVLVLPQYAKLYSGAENSPTVDEATQAAYYAQAVARYLACRPSISEVLFFHLVDETNLSGFQSGLLRPDGSRRPVFDAVQQAIAAGCTGAQSSWQPQPPFAEKATAGATGTKAAPKPKPKPRKHKHR